MKKNRLRRCVIGLFMLAGAVCVRAAGPSDKVISALKSGDAGRLCAWLAPDALVVVPGKTVPERQQCAELTRFFEANKPKNFVAVHQGTKQDACFVIGTLEAADQKFRINVLVRNADDDVRIQQLRIERE